MHLRLTVRKKRSSNAKDESALAIPRPRVCGEPHSLRDRGHDEQQIRLHTPRGRLTVAAEIAFLFGKL